jgi:hypothetical protein
LALVPCGKSASVGSEEVIGIGPEFTLGVTDRKTTAKEEADSLGE